MSSIMSDILKYLLPNESMAFLVPNKLVSHAYSNTVDFFVSNIEHNFLK